MLEDISNQGGAAAYIHQSQIIKRCPTCTKDYKQQHIKVVEEQTGTAIVHITCGECKQAVIAILGQTSFGIGLIGLTTDLTLEDTKRLRHTEPLSENDLLNFVEFISKNQLNIIFTQGKI